ncbi:MAG: hypothetical protein H6R14_2093 [Proteobacteria bacterium]|nr:hypothetical protein [Pseudomonadota bacterium]
MSSPNILPSVASLPLEGDRRLRDILDSLDAAVQCWDAQGSLTYANPASAVLFGSTVPLVPGLAVADFTFDAMLPDGRKIAPEKLPFARVLCERVPIAEEILRIIGRDGEERWLRCSARPLLDETSGDFAGAVTTQTDVSGLVEQEQRLRQMAHYDALTHLPNRVLFADRLSQALARCQRTHELIAVCLLDLDGFKPVNDRLGHKAGDQVLREVAQRLNESVRGDDTVARVGGDEFAMVLGGMKSLQDCDNSLQRILDCLARPYFLADQIVSVSASIGVTLYPNDGSEQDILLRHADQAMYKAKEAGKNRYMLFDPGHEQRVRATHSMLSKIEKSISANQFCLFYQPMIDCRRGRVVGAEALVRWQHPVLGLMAPSEFLPLIEQDDLIVVLGDWVLRDGLAQAAEWSLMGLDLRVSVNISARQLHRRDFVEKLRAITDGYPPEVIRKIEIEIVETAALEDVNTVSDSIRECRAMGISVALDDFGTGFSSLVHLKRLQANVLKIDQIFVRGMLDDSEDLAIVSGVIGLAAAFKHEVVAEGVETIDHILMLRELGCDIMQGYGFARPMPADRIPHWVESFRPDPLWNIAESSRPNRDYFELLLAETNHRAWLDQMLLSSRLPGKMADPEACLGHEQCRFSRWYDSEAAMHFRHLPCFDEIDAVHRCVHRKAVDLVRAHESGNLALVELAENDINEASSELVRLLRQLRLTIAAEKPEEAPDGQKT